MNTRNTEKTTKSSLKIVLGLRLHPNHKQDLSNQASLLGITLSEHTENLLLNASNISEELKKSKKKEELLEEQIRELKRTHEIKELKNQKEVSDLESHKTKQQKSLDVLIKENETLKDQSEIINDRRLLKLLDKLKGQKDIVEDAEGGKWPIIYQTSKDLLKAMIYSFKLTN